MPAICHKIVTNTPPKGGGVGPKQVKSVKSVTDYTEPCTEPDAPSDAGCSVESALETWLSPDPLGTWPGYHGTRGLLDTITDALDPFETATLCDEDQALTQLELGLFEHESDVLDFAADKLNERLVDAKPAECAGLALAINILEGMALNGVSKRKRRFLNQLSHYLNDWGAHVDDTE